MVKIISLITALVFSYYSYSQDSVTISVAEFEYLYQHKINLEEVNKLNNILKDQFCIEQEIKENLKAQLELKEEEVIELKSSLKKEKIKFTVIAVVVVAVLVILKK